MTVRASRLGRSTLLLVLVAALAGALLLAVGAWFLAGDAGRAAGETPAGSSRAAERDAPVRAAEDTLRAPAQDRDAAASTRTEDTSGDLALGSGLPPDRTRFEGSGVLRGHVQVRRDDAPPDEWHLELVPSRVYAGAEHAVGRTQRYTAASFDFRVDDLPFGAYDVRAVAPGFNGAWLSFVLDASHDDSFVNLTLLPAGFLEGQLVDPAGAPLEGLELVLVALTDGSRWTTESDAFGRYRFERVLDGTYDLVVGSPEAPYRAPERLDLRAPSMTLPPIELAGLGILVVQVVDPEGAPLLDAQVTGNAPGRGPFEGRTDLAGTLLVEHLAAGRVHVRVTHPGHTDARQSTDLGAGGERTLHFVLGHRQ